ncbi:MAG: DUF4276 family protein [Magnetococcales bacterium]|nr:DUF4276 family protein [Magnetococcales bacterium]
MHFEILVEGQAELTVLSILMAQIVGPYQEPHTWRIHKHRGLGKLPDASRSPVNPKDATLLHNLPEKLRAYGRDMSDDEMVVVLVDLDDRPDCYAFKKELVNLLSACPKPPPCLFRIAVEELEAWFLGDAAAIRSAFPGASQAALESYVQDSQCGTWEKLAEVIHPGGMAALTALGGRIGKRSPVALQQKHRWAKEMAMEMDVERNVSPSFQCFRDGLRGVFKPQ